MNLFLDPQTQLPFFAGTYFPAETQNGQPGFADLLMRLYEAFDQKREELTGQSDKLANTLKQLSPPVLDPEMTDAELLQACRNSLAERFDQGEGGFGQSMKFAMPGSIERLLRNWAYARRAGGSDKDGLEMVMTSLTQIARGGIFDHLGGGFFAMPKIGNGAYPTSKKCFTTTLNCSAFTRKPSSLAVTHYLKMRLIEP